MSCWSIGLLLLLPWAFGHPISLSSAIVEVSEHQVRVELQIMLEDLVLYHGLAADGEMNYSASELKAAADKHQEFLLKYFSIYDGDGQRLEGAVENLDVEQIDSAFIAQRELMQRFVGLVLIYPLANQRPDFLTFVQNFGGDQSSLPAIMDLHVLRDDQFQESAQIAVGRSHTVRLDWTRQSDGRRETLAELRLRRKEQFQSRLGISSYSGLYSFLYITRFSVRHEILIPLLSLEQWLPIKREHPDFLEVEEQRDAEAAVREFFQRHSLVIINGQPVDAVVERLNFFGLDINDFALNAEPRRVSIHQARLGAILNYPSPSIPQSVTVSWNTFSDHAPFIDTVLLIGNEKPERFYFHPKSTEYSWNGDFSSPSVQPVLSEGPLGSTAEQRRVIQGLLTNIYRAFDFRNDEDVYDALSNSIRGDLLREIYLRVKRSLMMAEHGGELSRVLSVEVMDARPQANDSDTFEATWRVSSTSEHWGHVHTRLSEYRGRLTLAQVDAAWKLHAFQLLDEKRLQFDTSIRGYDSNR